jgi:hypothetical protein
VELSIGKHQEGKEKEVCMSVFFPQGFANWFSASIFGCCSSYNSFSDPNHVAFFSWAHRCKLSVATQFGASMLKLIVQCHVRVGRLC